MGERPKEGGSRVVEELLRKWVPHDVPEPAKVEWTAGVTQDDGSYLQVTWQKPSWLRLTANTIFDPPFVELRDLYSPEQQWRRPQPKTVHAAIRAALQKPTEGAD